MKGFDRSYRGVESVLNLKPTSLWTKYIDDELKLAVHEATLLHINYCPLGADVFTSKDNDHQELIMDQNSVFISQSVVVCSRSTLFYDG